jgi:hypothetical protein
MSSDKKVFDFPKAEITSEEKARRAMAEARRLASLAPGEWRLWIDRAAERLGVSHATLEGLISAIIKDSERKTREDKAEARRQEERVRREQEREQREQRVGLRFTSLVLHMNPALEFSSSRQCGRCLPRTARR